MIMEVPENIKLSDYLEITVAVTSKYSVIAFTYI